MARKERGIFERPKESGIWWVRYAQPIIPIVRNRLSVLEILTTLRLLK